MLAMDNKDKKKEPGMCGKNGLEWLSPFSEPPNAREFAEAHAWDHRKLDKILRRPADAGSKSGEKRRKRAEAELREATLASAWPIRPSLSKS